MRTFYMIWDTVLGEYIRTGALRRFTWARKPTRLITRLNGAEPNRYRWELIQPQTIETERV